VTSGPGVSRENDDAEAERLEQMWAGGFGNSYIERNADAGSKRGPFWTRTIDSLSPARVLEVGCNIGANLEHIAARVTPQAVFGVDVNETSLATLRTTISGINPVWARAQDLPFRDSWFDLVFTVGVLIHQPESSLRSVMNEIYRCSKRYILCAEYFAEQVEEIDYRGERGALFKRDYASLYLSYFPDLTVIHEESLDSEDGFDDVTCTVLQKSG
jgi:pseudaminic acid biosynthesis-associated methylase